MPLGRVLGVLVEIPNMIEYIVGAFVAFLLYRITNTVLANVVSETVCTLSDLGSQVLCVYMTNPVIGFLLMVVLVFILIAGFKVRFL